MSDGVYHNFEHSTTMNSVKERLSVATFFRFNVDSELGPKPSLISQQNQGIFQRLPKKKYFNDFFAWRLDGKLYLKFMKIDNRHECVYVK